MAVRPIDGEALWDKLEDALWYDNYDRDMAEKIVLEMPTLTPPNEWVNRVRELDELYTKFQIITGVTAEQPLEMFSAGYVLEKPDYSKSFEEMASLPETTPPNNPLTLDELREMHAEPVWIKRLKGLSVCGTGWAVVDVCPNQIRVWWFGSEVEDEPSEKDYGETWIAYSRPPEGEEDT